MDNGVLGNVCQDGTRIFDSFLYLANARYQGNQRYAQIVRCQVPLELDLHQGHDADNRRIAIDDDWRNGRAQERKQVLEPFHRWEPYAGHCLERLLDLGVAGNPGILHG